MKLLRLRDLAAAAAHDCSGTIAVASGILLPAMLAATAVAVDVAQAYLDRRTAQAVVDLAALNAANNIGIAEEAARATIAANKFQGVKSLQVVKGHYAADPGLEPGSRFQAGMQPYNAVQVKISKTLKLGFAATFIRGPLSLSVSAVGQEPAQASFSVGSRLAAVRGGIANQVLGGLLGINVSMTDMDYDALANASVRIDDLLGSIDGAADLRAATYDDVVAATVSLSNLLSGAATLLASENHAASITLSSIARGSPGALRVAINALFNIGSWGSASIGTKTAALSGNVTALDLLQAAALVANGQNQIALPLNVEVPGLIKLTATVFVGERPAQSSWVAAGETRSSVTTAQTRVRLIAEIAGSGALLGTTIRLPIYADLASARAMLDDVVCSDSEHEQSAQIGVLTGVGRVAIADLTDAEFARPPADLSPGRLVNTSLLSINAGAQMAVDNTDPVGLTFTSDDVVDNVTKRAHTTAIAGSVVTSLLNSAEIKIKALGITAPVVSKTSLLKILVPVAGSLDPILLELLEALGARVGEADVTVHGLMCGNSNLAG